MTKILKRRKIEVYLDGDTVRWILERFKENGAVGMVGLKVKAIIPIKD